jgi:hypothetical protein
MERISDIDFDNQLLEAVRKGLAGEPAEVQIEYRLDCIIRELDEMCGIAANPETIDLIEHQRIAVGQILTRIQLIASFLMARQPTQLRVIQNG